MGADMLQKLLCLHPIPFVHRPAFQTNIQVTQLSIAVIGFTQKRCMPCIMVRSVLDPEDVTHLILSMGNIPIVSPLATREFHQEINKHADPWLITSTPRYETGTSDDLQSAWKCWD